MVGLYDALLRAGQLGRTRPLGRPRMSWKKLVNEDLEAIGCPSDYSKKARKRNSGRDKIKGPYRHYPAPSIATFNEDCRTRKKVKSKCVCRRAVSTITEYLQPNLEYPHHDCESLGSPNFCPCRKASNRESFLY